jgi:hypothetical protein
MYTRICHSREMNTDAINPVMFIGWISMSSCFVVKLQNDDHQAWHAFIYIWAALGYKFLPDIY